MKKNPGNEPDKHRNYTRKEMGKEASIDDMEMPNDYAHGILTIDNKIHAANNPEDYKILIEKYGSKAAELLKKSSAYCIDEHEHKI